MDLKRQFGCHLFDDRVMRERLPANIYASLRAIRDEGHEWDPTVADTVAEAMKNWAMELGATHYIHWFAPIIGTSAGKHEAFVDGVYEGKPILSFSGKMLSKGEPDASSFPSGGVRATFEARGYTAWDPTSPAFVLGTTLYIPTAFCAYTGESLDQKTPVLRSMQAVNKQAVRVLHALGETDVKAVHSTVGAEQEYFLVDKKLFEQRLDLKVCGHTLLGAKPPKGQELEDHYYGSIGERVRAFMRELDEELWALGVPAKTEHNEVAPGQYELASVFAGSNVACDHNQIMMELMRKVAIRHDLACILHEKPFAGVNGSGKHNNWSLSTDTGKNLFKPGKDPASNTVFLVFLCAVLQAVDNYADLLRLSATCPGNDDRLGGNEAPPSVISVFLGDPLTRVLEAVATSHAVDQAERKKLLTGVKSLPLLTLDDSDRNRTSPFAFTGNKFEFRMVGSSQGIGLVNAVLNAIVADTLRGYADRLEQAADQQQEALAIIRQVYTEHGRIIFNGNNYSEEWREEAHRRGLADLSCMVEAVPALLEEKNIQMFARTKVFTPAECHSRYEVLMEHYAKTIRIDALTMLEMVDRGIVPATVEFLGRVARANYYAGQTGVTSKATARLEQRLAESVDAVSACSEKLREKLAQLPCTSATEEACALHQIWREEMAQLRLAADKLEELCAADRWPFPAYTDLLFGL
ncbi:MAG: glutamine synthetase III [Pygmaiobacter massiliensis]|nr:glutamine synthetase III [Pygmaiobacter massiliensis]